MTPQIPPQSPQQMPWQPKPSGRGCLFWGGIIAGILLLCVLITVYAGYCYVRGLVNEYTDSKPIEVAVTPLSEADAKALQRRIKDFDHALTNGTPTTPLIL